jgi:exosortase/archaeosortase family protein
MLASIKTRISRWVDWQIVLFVLRFFGLLIAWMVLYRYVLRPTHIPDRWLTISIAEVANVVINLVLRPEPLLGPVYFTSEQVAYLSQNGKFVFGIGDICNGLELIALYTGLLVLLPGTAKRKWKYFVAGIGMIYVFSVVRAVSLYYIYYNYYSYFLFNHKYVFTILMYAVIFTGWLMFARTKKQS